MNEKPFEYRARHGTVFTCERCDFDAPLYIQSMPQYPHTLDAFDDVAEMIGFHATNIQPKLDSFRGYDAIEWDVKR